MRLLLSCSLATLIMVGCATEPPSAQTAQGARERCDRMVTGTRIPRCDTGDVHSVSGDEFDRERRALRTPQPEHPTMAR